MKSVICKVSALALFCISFDLNAQIIHDAEQSLLQEKYGEHLGLCMVFIPTMHEKDYMVDDNFRPYGYITVIEGKKGGQAREMLPPTSIENLRPESKKYIEQYKDAFESRMKH